MAAEDRYVISGMESIEELRRIAEDRRSTLVLSLSSLRSMMSAFIEGRTNAETLEELAEYLEMNETLVVSPDESSRVNEVLFMLANPEINSPNDRRKVSALLKDVAPGAGTWPGGQQTPIS